MAGIYGSFLDEDNFYREKFLLRVNALKDICEVFLDGVYRRYPNSKDKISYSHYNTLISMVRYFNDLVRLKAMHNIDIVHRSKVASYIISWLNVNPVFVVTATSEELAEMDNETFEFIINIHHHFVSALLVYFSEQEQTMFTSKHYKSRKVYEIISDLVYYLETQSYEPHCCANIIKNLIDID